MKKAKQLLKSAKNLLILPENFTKGALWRDNDGFSSMNDKDAVCFCSYGALLYFLQKYEEKDYELAKSTLSSVMNNCITMYNDSHTHEEVLAKFDEAIALL